MNTALKVGVAAFCGFAIGFAGAGGSAKATTPKTITVTWSTTADPAKPLPTDASNVPWPQHLLSPVPACLPKATVVQVDVYEYVGHKAAVDALIAHGTLNKPGSASWSDSDFVQSWTFRVIPACVNASPTGPVPTSPTPTVSSSTPTPAPSTTSVSSTPAPSSTAPAPTSAAPVVSTPTPWTSSAAVVPPKSTLVAPSPSANTDAPTPLANTGAPTGRLTLIALALLAAGTGLAFITRKGKRA